MAVTPKRIKINLLQGGQTIVQNTTIVSAGSGSVTEKTIYHFKTSGSATETIPAYVSGSTELVMDGRVLTPKDSSSDSLGTWEYNEKDSTTIEFAGNPGSGRFCMLRYYPA